MIFFILLPFIVLTITWAIILGVMKSFNWKDSLGLNMDNEEIEDSLPTFKRIVQISKHATLSLPRALIFSILSVFKLFPYFITGTTYFQYGIIITE
jgi:hypothetical protein